MNKHTAGPWTVTDGIEVCGADYPGRGLIARVNVHRGDDAAANARLIAATPELLEALRSLLATLQTARDIGKLKGGELSAEADARRLLAKLV